MFLRLNHGFRHRIRLLRENCSNPHQTILIFDGWTMVLWSKYMRAGRSPPPPGPMHSAAMHSAHSSARHSSRPSQVSGPPPSRASAPSLRTIRQQEYQEAPSRPVHQTRRMPAPAGNYRFPEYRGYGIHGSLAAVAA